MTANDPGVANHSSKRSGAMTLPRGLQYAAHANGANIHITGPEEREVRFGNGITSFATLSGGEAQRIKLAKELLFS